jgi:8-oxo-dGTP pyrophosphatase MutT (NUDIX family)
VTAYRNLVAAIVTAVDPLDGQEATDRADTLAWVAGGAPLCRTAKPATPPEHLVAYSVVVDPGARRLLLVDHRLSGLWLPPGGHVDPGEHPAETARRELREELGIDAPAVPGVPAPLMVTRATTVGEGPRHVDVSLWYAFAVPEDRPLAYDRREFLAIRWWPATAIAHTPTTRFDPNLPRFVTKLIATFGWE